MFDATARAALIATLAAATGLAGAVTPGCKTQTKKCHVIVTVAAGGTTCAAVTLVENTTRIQESETGNGSYRIVWVLDGNDHEFLASGGDGVMIKPPSQGVSDPHQGQFTNGFLAKNDDGDYSGKASEKRYRWRFENEVKGKWKYAIQFRKKTDPYTVFTCDPTITNLDAG